jgi:hypothetical protein
MRWLLLPLRERTWTHCKVLATGFIFAIKMLVHSRECDFVAKIVALLFFKTQPYLEDLNLKKVSGAVVWCSASIPDRIDNTSQAFMNGCADMPSRFFMGVGLCAVPPQI